ncbi:unnamed protein product [Protopolystoma xenopodis]|uniref:Uncharacterized protein n=1 Tax=Protopolystoma xenopodis TaxID=117903 RepID=A0A448WMJ7_9PLAT|nr:unnamed protein product [Protopolystoma xenopodis]
MHFTVELPFTVLFKPWLVDTNESKILLNATISELVGAFFGVLILAFLYEGLKAFRASLLTAIVIKAAPERHPCQMGSSVISPAGDTQELCPHFASENNFSANGTEPRTDIVRSCPVLRLLRR